LFPCQKKKKKLRRVKWIILLIYTPPKLSTITSVEKQHFVKCLCKRNDFNTSKSKFESG
jgi:hypothetical protein